MTKNRPAGRRINTVNTSPTFGQDAERRAMPSSRTSPTVTTAKASTVACDAVISSPPQQPVAECQPTEEGQRARLVRVQGVVHDVADRRMTLARRPGEEGECLETDERGDAGRPGDPHPSAQPVAWRRTAGKPCAQDQPDGTGHERDDRRRPGERREGAGPPRVQSSARHEQATAPTSFDGDRLRGHVAILPSGARQNGRMSQSVRPSSLDPQIADRLKRDANGLVCAVTQQWDTGEVLMVGWMDDEALHRTLTTGRCTYWSRSRQEYWVKGETSGHQQWVKSVALDCDGDALLVQVDQVGAACHTGERRCFDSGGDLGAVVGIPAP